MEDRGARSRRKGAKGQTGRRESTSFWDIPSSSAAAAAGGAPVLSPRPGRRRRFRRTIKRRSAAPRMRTQAVRQPPFSSRRVSRPCGCSRAEERGQRGQQGRAWGRERREPRFSKRARNALASLDSLKENRDPVPPLRAPPCPARGTIAAALGGTAFPWPFSWPPREKPRSSSRGRTRTRKKRNEKKRPTYFDYGRERSQVFGFLGEPSLSSSK